VSAFRGARINQECRKLVVSQGCQFHSNLEANKSIPALQAVMDIEELAAAGRSHATCPYFLSKDRLANADLVFMPYNYCVDPGTRGAIQLDLHNAVLIFDEAHNLESVCEESASFVLTSTALRQVLRELDDLMREKHILSEDQYTTAATFRGEHALAVDVGLTASAEGLAKFIGAVRILGPPFPHVAEGTALAPMLQRCQITFGLLQEVNGLLQLQQQAMPLAVGIGSGMGTLLEQLMKVLEPVAIKNGKYFTVRLPTSGSSSLSHCLPCRCLFRQACRRMLLIPLARALALLGQMSSP
jgi:hypothetical protein